MFKPFNSLSVIAIVGTGVVVGAAVSVISWVGVGVAVALARVGSTGCVADGTIAVQAVKNNWLNNKTESNRCRCFCFKYASHEREWMGVEPTSALPTRH